MGMRLCGQARALSQTPTRRLPSHANAWLAWLRSWRNPNHQEDKAAMSHDVRLDCSLLKPALKVRALEPAEQLIFCENVVVLCQTLQDQTAELLIAILDWIEEKNLPQHIGKSATAYLQTLKSVILLSEQSPPQHSSSNSYFGSLHSFKPLESLCIQPEVLLGGCCESLVAPFRLKDTKPSALESLTFYGDEEGTDSDDDTSRPTELKDIKHHRFVHLST